MGSNPRGKPCLVSTVWALNGDDDNDAVVGIGSEEENGRRRRRRRREKERISRISTFFVLIPFSR